MIDLKQVRHEILDYFELIRDKQGPHGCYRQGPGKRPDCYASCDVVITRTVMGEDLQQTLSEEERAGWVKHINSYYFQGNYHDRFNHSHWHANGMVIGALGPLGGHQIEPCPLYKEFDTKEKCVAWLDNIDWRAQWGASHYFWGGMHCFSMSKRCTDEWRTWVFDWLDAELDSETGWWRKGVPHADRHQPLGGSVHIIPIYEHHGRTFPYPDKLIDSTLDLQVEPGCWLDRGGSFHMNYLELDALYALRFGMRYADGYRTADIMAAVERFAEGVEKHWPAVSAAHAHQHPHSVEANMGCFGLLQQFLPERFPDDQTWTDIFSDLRLYQTDKIEVLTEEK